ncbi:MAG: hypothetical protein K0R38_3978 [Polyangiaceae bacterium]|jgi:hypothetical protein|nr:hypothetical protein [Polyangiaceae bacterium]
MKRFWLALAVTAAGCFAPNDNVLFDQDEGVGASGGSASIAGATSSAGAQSGTDSGQYVSGAPGGGAGGTGAGGTGSGGSSLNGGTSSLGGSGGSGGDAPPIPVVESCDMVVGSVVSPLDGHCYRVNETELTFAEASDACERAAGHLVTISSPEENDFARDLHDGEHWIGATDQRAYDAPGVGPYVWVSGEPWEYSDWEEGQPNAFEVDCPADEDTDCYEHCGFQSDEGDWNDRSCWHTIVSICEWDVTAVGGEGGASGAGGAAEPTPYRPNGPR